MNSQTKNINKIEKKNLETLLGRVGTKPDLKYVKGEKLAICKFRFAVDNGKKNDPDWINVVAFSDLAEMIESEVKIGDQLFLRGKTLERTWIDSEGTEKLSREFRVNVVAPVLK